MEETYDYFLTCLSSTERKLGFDVLLRTCKARPNEKLIGFFVKTFEVEYNDDLRRMRDWIESIAHSEFKLSTPVEQGLSSSHDNENDKNTSQNRWNSRRKRVNEIAKMSVDTPSSIADDTSNTMKRKCQLEDLVYSAIVAILFKQLFVEGHEAYHQISETLSGIIRWSIFCCLSNYSESLIMSLRLMTAFNYQMIKSKIVDRNVWKGVSLSCINFAKDIVSIPPTEITKLEEDFVKAFFDSVVSLVIFELDKDFLHPDADEQHCRYHGRNMSYVLSLLRSHQKFCQWEGGVGSVHSTYSYFANAAKSRFTAWMDQFESNEESGKDNLEWLRLSFIVKRVLYILNEETLEEEKLLEEECSPSNEDFQLEKFTMQEVVGIVGLRPISITSAIYGELLQVEITKAVRQHRGGRELNVDLSNKDVEASVNGKIGANGKSAPFDMIFAVYKDLIQLSKTLSSLIENDFSCIDYSDDESDSSINDKPDASTVSDVLRLDSFNDVISSWGEETKIFFEKMTLHYATSQAANDFNYLANVVDFYSSMFDTLDIIKFSFESVSSSMAISVSVDILTSAIHRHSVLLSAAITSQNKQQQEYVTAPTKGLSPMRKKSISLIRNVIIKNATTCKTEDYQQQQLKLCAVKLAEIDFSKDKSKEIQTSILQAVNYYGGCQHKERKNQLRECENKFQDLFDELNCIHADIMDSFVTALLIRNTTKFRSNSVNGSLLNNMINNEVESSYMKGYERKLYKAIKNIKDTSDVINNKRSQQLIDDAYKVCGDCLESLTQQLSSVFSINPRNLDTTLVQKVMKEMNSSTVKDILLCIFSRLVNSIGAAASASKTALSEDEISSTKETSTEDTREDMKQQNRTFRFRGWSRSSSSDSVENNISSRSDSCGESADQKVVVALSFISEIENTFQFFFGKLALQFEIPSSVQSTKAILRTSSSHSSFCTSQETSL